MPPELTQEDATILDAVMSMAAFVAQGRDSMNSALDHIKSSNDIIVTIVEHYKQALATIRAQAEKIRELEERLKGKE